ncbi:single-stranded-DNA-specific exonuclease RecJ [Nitrosomonas stercoris]|uniref:Single-stranded-DNA-specific exonuclease RecJ n=1 Tax=Nitrosomonas stercoris TaxID=1444684 RepID=A0A4Y1YKU9_9PROT|nr:single-stranded-DNA-specific exonuclease RecJ [Nitrosomonas stercoris]
MTNIAIRKYSSQAYKALIAHGLSPVLARVFAARGIEHPNQLETTFSRMASFEQLKGIQQMAALLADAIAAKKHLLIVADYDADGATACVVAVRALRQFGAIVDYLVPNRFEYGYGLTPDIVQLAASQQPAPDILITVDNGIASVEGVAEANRLGIQVFVTDHHLPGNQLPDATVIVNPNQPGCNFPDKHIAGVGVIFYVMLALRAELRTRGVFTAATKEPNLANLLDLVALGTVADVVRLEGTNRVLVQQGLHRIRNGRCCIGIHALLKVAKRDIRRVSAYELGFVLAPRLNAAGRLDDMSLGIECLLAEDESRAASLAEELDELNRQRREIEADMRDEALNKVDGLIQTLERADTSTDNEETASVYSLCLYDADWHQGVIGLIASRLKDRLHRPVIIFAQGNDGEIKGSGRSIPGLHLRDALDLVAKRHPELIIKFGGHAMAAGLTINEQHFAQFRTVFEQIVQSLLTPADLVQIIETDGELAATDLTLALAQHLSDQVWGQGFPEPCFNGCFQVENQRIVGGKHLKLKLRKAGARQLYEAIWFFHAERLPTEIDAVYRVQLNEYNGNTHVQLLLEHCFEIGRVQYG